jgi:SAM-dependent methyltransferase
MAARKHKKVEVYVPEIETKPLKLDIGCGTRKQPGFVGIDSLDFEGVDHVIDVRKGLPFEDCSVDEIYSNHFVEHLTGEERVPFMNELYRVMKVGAIATIIAPCWSHSCAYGDPTHKFPPISQWTQLYWNAAWRKDNGPHTGYTCDFDYTLAGSWDSSIEGRNAEYKQNAMNTQINAWRDIIFTLTKK